MHIRTKILTFIIIVTINIFGNSIITNPKITQEITTNRCIITKDTILSLNLLDSCWRERQNIITQKSLGDYLLSAPFVPDDYEITWKTARLVYFIGNFGVGEKRFVDTKEGVKLFYYGVGLGKSAIKLNQSKVDGHYWYAINLGSYGLAKGILFAAANAKSGMNALKKAMEIDPSYEFYGSSRILGRYYQELPRIFGGSNAKALEMFLNATKNSPEFDNNWLFLGRFYLSIKDYTNALSICTNASKLPAQEGDAEEVRYKKEINKCIKDAKAGIFPSILPVATHTDAR